MASRAPGRRICLDQYRGRVALVTGASTGIGAGICRTLVNLGMTVLGCAIRVERVGILANELITLSAPGRLIPYLCDLSSETAIAAMFEHIKNNYRSLDVCINNAGIATDTPLMTGDTAMWRNMLDVNVLGLCICTKQALQMMSDDAIIIQVGCIMGHKVPDLQQPENKIPNLGFHYGMKFMIRGLAESLRHELKRQDSKIRVALISPGAVETELFARCYGAEAADAFYGSVRCLQPKDIGDAVAYILQTPTHVNVQDILVQPSDYWL